MDLGIIGLGRMGANMVRRLLKADHGCVVFDRSREAVKELVREKAAGAASWLLDLTAISLAEDQELSKFAGRVSDSGEGRWTIKAAIDEAVPASVLTTALHARFSSRGEADYADTLLSAMRFQFGGHLEKQAARPIAKSRR
jgi:6-phosphogluconate dehydrogenase